MLSRIDFVDLIKIKINEDLKFSRKEDRMEIMKKVREMKGEGEKETQKWSALKVAGGAKTRNSSRR